MLAGSEPNASGLSSSWLQCNAELEADELAHADEALPEGTRICVAGRGRGAYVSFGKKTFGANEHTIAFDSGETATVKLKEVEWTVKENEMDATTRSGDTGKSP